MASISIRDNVIEFLKTLPKDVSLEDIMYHLYVKEKLLKAKQEIKEGKVLTQEEIEDQSKTWFTK